MSAPTSRKPLPFSRKLLLAGLLAVLLLGLLEGGVRCGMAVLRPQVTLSALFDAERRVAEVAADSRRYSMPEVAHPYVGFVVDPTHHPQFNRYGFCQVDGPIVERRPERLIVGITGGSVAVGLCDLGGHVLKRELARAFPGREIVLVCLAQQGFRQPQQVAAWTFFRCLGAEFDVLVNLDGFNDIVLHTVESPSDRMWFAYPRGWDLRLIDTEDPTLNRLLWEGHHLRQTRQAWAARFVPAQRLPLMAWHLAWSVRDRSLANRLAEVMRDVVLHQDQLQQRYGSAGPVERFDSAEARFTAQANWWANCSLRLAEACRAAGTEYLHALQPNQHVPGSKGYTVDEVGLAFATSNSYSDVARDGYPYLVLAGADLRSRGVDFHDLTQIFADNTEVLYADDCCHFNTRGNELLAVALAQRIAARRGGLANP
uniref:SGNH/GDSL hydrolase family protein n=1 Tax=Schlesneria paludicola TaxID=360056 RepID=A0A7C4LKJ9_9PLAN